jgi:hypothetical protein
MEYLIDQWAASKPVRGFHRMKVSEFHFELRAYQDNLPRDQWIKINANNIAEVLRKKSRDAIETAVRDGKEWWIWQGSQRTSDDKKSTRSIKPEL